MYNSIWHAGSELFKMVCTRISRNLLKRETVNVWAPSPISSLKSCYWQSSTNLHSNRQWAAGDGSVVWSELALTNKIEGKRRGEKKVAECIPDTEGKFGFAKTCRVSAHAHAGLHVLPIFLLWASVKKKRERKKRRTLLWIRCSQTLVCIPYPAHTDLCT